MAAPTSTYCDYGTGNDYKGTTFTDGAYTQATKNLNKTGAFTASQVNHWLYISGTHITTGYYKIATKTDNDNVVLATDASSDGNNSTDVTCTQAAGTTAKPWRSIQGALDLITRDATNGDQINIKASTAQVLAASLVATTYGGPAATVPLILRGYTDTAGDGGIAEIDCNGSTMWSATNLAGLKLFELQIHNFGNANGVYTTGTNFVMYKCNVHKGASSPSSKSLVICYTTSSSIIQCHIHDAGTSGVGIGSVGGLAYGNYIKDCPTGITCRVNTGGAVINNLIIDCTTAGITGTVDQFIIGNTIYVSTSATGQGILNPGTGVVLNNIIEGYIGSGGVGISSNADIDIIGYNAFYNNATPESYTGDLLLDLGNDATLAASPFTNAASGDFSLKTSVSGAIDGAFPGTWYGPASTTDHADIGAVQNGAGASGGLLRHPGMTGGISG